MLQSVRRRDDGQLHIRLSKRLKEKEELEEEERNCRNVFHMQKCFVCADPQLTSDLSPHCAVIRLFCPHVRHKLSIMKSKSLLCCSS